MPALAFAVFAASAPGFSRARTTCSAARPPNDPSSLRTESERRRNSPPKPLRRRRRRRGDDDLDWDAMESVPIVRPDAPPESGEDYWVDADELLEPSAAPKPAPAKPLDEAVKQRLRQEVVSPYENNWILWVVAVVAVLVLLVKVFGGLDTLPIISVPDL